MMPLKEIEQHKEQMQKRMMIAQKKIDILVKKLEECKKNNEPLPPSVCNTKPLDEAKDELKQCRIALVHLSNMQQIQSYKQGDTVTCYASLCHNIDRATDFRSLDYALALARAKNDGWYSRDIAVAELEIDEIRKDGRILAKSIHNPKKQFLGIPLHETDRYDQTETDTVVFYRLL